MGKPSNPVQGTLDLLILKTISLEPKRGWAIANLIQQISNEVLQVRQGSPTPLWASQVLLSLTATGRAQLEKEAANWSRLSGAINLVVDST